jgi:hypothetical protein
MKPRQPHRHHHHHEHHHQHHQQQQPRRTENESQVSDCRLAASRSTKTAATVLTTSGQSNCESEERHRHAVIGGGDVQLKPSNLRLVVNASRGRTTSNNVDDSLGCGDEISPTVARPVASKTSKVLHSVLVMCL